MYKVGLLLLVVMSSCGSRENLSEEELRLYILDESNGLYKKNLVNDGLVEVYYQPAELVWVHELSELNPADRILRLKTLDSLMYFVTRISWNERDQFTSKVDYHSSDDYRDFSLVCDADTVQAIDVITESSFSISDPGISILAVFPRKTWWGKCSNVTFYFNDQSFGIGSKEFSFNLAKIENVPSLN